MKPNYRLHFLGDGWYLERTTLDYAGMLWWSGYCSSSAEAIGTGPR